MITLSFHLNSTFFRENIRKHVQDLKRINTNTQNGGMPRQKRVIDDYMDLQDQWKYLMDSFQDRNKIYSLLRSIQDSMIDKKGNNYLKYNNNNYDNTGLYIHFTDNSITENPIEDKTKFKNITSDPKFHISFHYGDTNNSQVNIGTTREIDKEQGIGLCHITHSYKIERGSGKKVKKRVWEKTFPFYFYRYTRGAKKTLRIKMVQSIKDISQSDKYSKELYLHYRDDIVDIFKDGINNYLDEHFTLVRIGTILQENSQPLIHPIHEVQQTPPTISTSSRYSLLEDDNNDNESNEKSGGKKRRKTRKHKTRKHKTRKHKTRKHKYP